MKLEIVTPEQIVFSGEVSSVSVPGKKGIFTIWKDHAPIIATMKAGTVRYISDLNHYEVETGPGVMEAGNNEIVLCVETAIKK